MKRLLLPEGFVHARGGTYVRKAGDQIHLIDFQPSQWGHSYTINVGFHYGFIKGFFHDKRLAPAAFHLLDCALFARIGAFVPGGIDTWYDYGTDRDQLQSVFEQNTLACLKIFMLQAEKWQHPKKWLENISDRGRVNPAFVKPWQLRYPHFFAASIAREVGQIGLARKHAKRFIDGAPSDAWRRAFTRLARNVV